MGHLGELAAVNANAAIPSGSPDVQGSFFPTDFVDVLSKVKRLQRSAKTLAMHLLTGQAQASPPGKDPMSCKKLERLTLARLTCAS